MKTKAAILYKLNAPLVIDEIEIPALLEGQILVKILYTAMCRGQYNEIIGLKGPDPFLPHLLGHEASALVEKIGPKVSRVKPGDYVALSWIKGPGLEAPKISYKLGRKTINAGAVATFSEFSVVSENRVTKISRRLPPEIASILGCAVATGSGIIFNTLKVPSGSSIAVFGAGGIGSSVILAARKAGASIIVAVDIAPQKFAWARKMGATHIVDGRKALLAQLRKIAPDGVDFAVECSGAKHAMEAAFQSIKNKGTCVIAGNLGQGGMISLNPFDLIKGKRIIGTWGGETQTEKDLPHYVKEYLKGQFPIDRLITHRFKLEQINQAFDVLKNGEAGRIILEVHPDE